MQEQNMNAEPQGRFVQYPDSPFELFQPYPPAGDQPVAIENWLKASMTASLFRRCWA